MGGLSSIYDQCCKPNNEKSPDPSRVQTRSPRSHLANQQSEDVDENIKSEDEILIQQPKQTENNTPTKSAETSQLKLKLTDSNGKKQNLRLTNFPSLPHSIQELQYSKTEDVNRSTYFVQFVKKENKIDTEFTIKPIEEYVTFKNNNYNNDADNIEWPLDYYWDSRTIESTHFYWSIFTKAKGIHKRVPGYFKILDYIDDDDNKDDEKAKDENQTISSEHLKVFLYFLHHPKIRSYLEIKDREYWDKYDISININNQQYKLQFWNGKEINQCQGLVVLKNNTKKNKYKKVYSLYFPKPNKSIEWRWYDPDIMVFRPYETDDPLQILELEASYYGNIQTNFPITNRLFCSQLNTSIFDHCYLHKFSKKMNNQNYCIRYTLSRNQTSDESYDIVMDQIRLEPGKLGYPRSVERHFDRQKYLETVLDSTIKKTLTLDIAAVNPIITSVETDNDTTYKHDPKVKWVGLWDKTPSEGNKYNLNIISQFDDEKSTLYSAKTIRTAQGMEVKTIIIKEPELITNRCKKFMWVKFKKNKTKLCKFANGFWDISFDSDGKYKQLRQHLDGILSIIQYKDVQDHFDIKNNNESNESNILYITIDKEYEYELLYYNNLNRIHKAHAIIIKQKIKQLNNKSKPYRILKMHIMYFLKPKEKLHYWQWYDNNKCKYMNYDNINECLQLECSYLSNLYENYPKNIVHNYFTHCIFTTFMQRDNTTRDKVYVLRYSIIEELHNKVVVEQVAYTDNRNFPRIIRKIGLDELQKEEKNQYVPSMDIEYDNNNNPYATPIINFNAPTPTFNMQNIKMLQTLDDVIQRFTQILVAYQGWLCSTHFDKSAGMVTKLLEMYGIEDKPAQLAIIKLRNDFKLLKTEVNKLEDSDNEMTKISDDINKILKSKFDHKSDNCLCVRRTNRDRKVNDSQEKYFGFTNTLEVITQQMLDSYHCVLLHLYDIKDTEEKLDKWKWKYDDDIDEEEEEEEESKEKEEEKEEYLFVMKKQMSVAPKSSHSRNRTSSLILFNNNVHKNKKNKFTTYTTYDTGYRFYYWNYYKFNTQQQVLYQDTVADPGNVKPNGQYYRFEYWYVHPSYEKLKREILEFGDNFGYPIGINQFEEEYEKAMIHLNSEEGRNLKCNESIWEAKYGLKKGNSIEINHLLSIQLYCSFTDAVAKFTQTFRKNNESESDEELKNRHKPCALWAKYLRECVEGFGVKLKKGNRGIPGEYYRGITKQFLFKKTILHFNGVLSTTVSEGIAENFAKNSGLVLTLKPHWGDYPGNIRAWDCSSYSDYPWEREYLFIGGLEPLVIENIRENKIGGKIYVREIQTINNIYQIFEGMACKFTMKPKLIKTLIDNRLIDKLTSKPKDYISQIFDYYCDNVSSIKIRLSLMDRSYGKIVNNFMDNTNTLKLNKIIQLFPKCKLIRLYDGFNYQLIPTNTQYIDTILHVIQNCIQYINNIKPKHPLKCIYLETNEAIQKELFQMCQQQLQNYKWCCKNINSDEFKYKIYADQS